MKLLRLLSILSLSLGFFPSASDAAVLLNPYNGVNLNIPDDGSTVSDTHTVTADFNSIVSLTVTLTVIGIGDGAWNGDYYATLTHGSALSVLLNRTGTRAGSTVGYGDNGFNNITFDDSAANGDIHTYRFTLKGNNSIPLGGPLTGTWAPDGRNVDPNGVLDTTGRSAYLSDFSGLNPNGDWTLAISDLSSGGTGQLTSWSLQITAVPEPSEFEAMAAIGLLIYAFVRGGNRFISRRPL
jgi:hypothetical protein